ncbi:MAG: dTDP-4-dehydrorhamnose reductase [Limnohabitans sp.]
MAAEPVLLLGAAGQLGHALKHALEQAGYPVVAWTRADLDLSHLTELKRRLAQLKPRWILNAAAYTAVDKAQTEREQAHLVNAQLPAMLAEHAKASGAALIHFSSDYVFNGRSTRPYLETDATDPLSVYGQSKRDGDAAVQASGARHLIFRSSWVVAAHGQNFLKTMLRLATERDQLNVVADQTGVPTAATWLAQLALLAMPLAEREGLNGLFHATPGGQTTWHGYARHVLVQAAKHGWPLKAAADQVLPITTAQYLLPAQRPAYGLLDSSLLAYCLQCDWPDWQTGVDQVVAQLCQQRLVTM